MLFLHVVWKCWKVSFNILSGQKFIKKYQKLSILCEFLKTWSLLSNSAVRRQVTFEKTKSKNSNVTFWVIFQLCVLLSFRSTASDETIEPPQDEEPPTIQQPKKTSTLRKLTNKEIEHEAQMCSILERKIADLKSDLTDKKVVFDKLMAELFRMLGVFDRLEKLHETKGNEIVEAESAVNDYAKWSTYGT